MFGVVALGSHSWFSFHLEKEDAVAQTAAKPIHKHPRRQARSSRSGMANLCNMGVGWRVGLFESQKGSGAHRMRRMTEWKYL